MAEEPHFPRRRVEEEEKSAVLSNFTTVPIPRSKDVGSVVVMESEPLVLKEGEAKELAGLDNHLYYCLFLCFTCLFEIQQ